MVPADQVVATHSAHDFNDRDLVLDNLRVYSNHARLGAFHRKGHRVENVERVILEFAEDEPHDLRGQAVRPSAALVHARLRMVELGGRRGIESVRGNTNTKGPGHGGNGDARKYSLQKLTILTDAMAEMVTFLKYLGLQEEEVMLGRGEGRLDVKFEGAHRGNFRAHGSGNHVLFNPRAFSKIKVAKFASLRVVWVKLVDLIASWLVGVGTSERCRGRTEFFNSGKDGVAESCEATRVRHDAAAELMTAASCRTRSVSHT